MPIDGNDRNHLWLGLEISSLLESTPLAIVGSGGNGALLALHAAQVGFRHLIVCDDDLVEASNLNRLPMSTLGDIGRKKVHVLERFLRERFDGIQVRSVEERFPSPIWTEAALEAPVVACCVDTIHARLEVCAWARSRGKSLVDLGSGFCLDEGSGAVSEAGGQVVTSSPTGPCLLCLGFGHAIQADYFAPGSRIPEPSSVLVNAVVAAIAVEAIVWELTHTGGRPNRISYDRGRARIDLATVENSPDCPLCGDESIDNLFRLGTRVQILGTTSSLPALADAKP